MNVLSENTAPCYFLKNRLVTQNLLKKFALAILCVFEKLVDKIPIKYYFYSDIFIYSAHNRF